MVSKFASNPAGKRLQGMLGCRWTESIRTDLNKIVAKRAIILICLRVLEPF